ncbi:MAG: site-specific integrase, partial [Nocardioides sp.]
MTVRKTPGGRWRGQLKSGRTVVATKTFDTQRAARDWVVRERAAMAGGVDPRAGRRKVIVLVHEWLEMREHTVARKTYVADAALPRLMPKALSALNVSAVTDREVSRALVVLRRAGLADASVKRFRASLSSFFAWAVRERL